MNDTRPYWKVIVSLVFSLVGTLLFVVAGYGLLRLFLPFVIGWLIACIVNPMVCWLEKHLKIVKKWGSVITIVVVLGAVVALLYLAIANIVREAAEFAKEVPGIYEEMEQTLQRLGKTLKNMFDFLPGSVGRGWSFLISNLDTAVGKWIGNMGEPTVEAAGNVAKGIPSVFIGMIMTILSAYLFVAEREEVICWVKKITPGPVERRMSMVVYNLKYAIGGYFKAQLEIMLILGVILFIGFLILNVNYAFIIALLVAFLDFLPFLGTAITLIPWAAYKFFQQDYKMAVGLLVLYLLTQLTRQLIQPKLVGDKVGLKPLPTLLFLYLGYRIGSVWGLIFAVPVGMILINMYRAGAFDYILNDVKILVKGIRSLRE